MIEARTQRHCMDCHAPLSANYYPHLDRTVCIKCSIFRQIRWDAQSRFEQQQEERLQEAGTYEI